MKKTAFIVCLALFCVTHVFAEKQIKVSTIGAAIPGYSNRTDMENIVKEIIGFWDQQIKQVLPDQPDLILLPEFFDMPSGFSTRVQEEFIKIRGSKIQDFIAATATQNKCYIAFGTLLTDEAGNLRNAAVLVDRKGKQAGIYYKNFPTIGEIESGIVSGTESPVFECDFGRVGMAICFDLNFEELRDSFAEKKPDVLLFMSMYHGGHMQKNWAYACRSYFVGAISGRGTPSEVRDPLGEVVASTSNYNNYATATINLNSRLVHLGYNFEKLSLLKARYGSNVHIKDPGCLGPVLVTGLDEKIPIDRMLKEFEIENMHDYYNRSRAVRAKQLKIQ
ncbi:carbon-nitrogen hydrolase family protein [Ravibacter arvi]